MENELEPCPYKHGKESHMVILRQEDENGTDGNFFASCVCGARGPSCEDRQEAIDRWNTRHPELTDTRMREALEEIKKLSGGDGPIQPDSFMTEYEKAAGECICSILDIALEALQPNPQEEQTNDGDDEIDSDDLFRAWAYEEFGKMWTDQFYPQLHATWFAALQARGSKEWKEPDNPCVEYGTGRRLAMKEGESDE